MSRSRKSLGQCNISSHRDFKKSLDDGSYTVALRLLNQCKFTIPVDVQKTLFKYAVKRGVVRAIKLFNTRIIDDFIYDSVTALYHAAYFGNSNMVAELLEYGANTETPNNYGDTPLIIATRYYHLDIVKMLLDHMADINATNHDGKSALIYAVSIGSTDLVSLLLNKGANINVNGNSVIRHFITASTPVRKKIIDLILAAGHTFDDEDRNFIRQFVPGYIIPPMTTRRKLPANYRKFIVLGHGYEIDIPMKNRLKVPPNTYVVTFSQHGCSLYLGLIAKIVHMYNEDTIDLSSLKQGFHIYPPRSKLPYLVNTLRLDHQGITLKSGVYEGNVPDWGTDGIVQTKQDAFKGAIRVPGGNTQYPILDLIHDSNMKYEDETPKVYFYTGCRDCSFGSEACKRNIRERSSSSQNRSSSASTLKKISSTRGARSRQS